MFNCSAQLGLAWLGLSNFFFSVALTFWATSFTQSATQTAQVFAASLVYLFHFITSPLVYLLHLLLVVAFLRPLLHGTFGNFFDRFHSHFWLDYASIRNCLSGWLSDRPFARPSVCLPAWLADWLVAHMLQARLDCIWRQLSLICWLEICEKQTQTCPHPPFYSFSLNKNTTKY